MKEYKVSKQESNQRIDKFIKKYLPNAPLSLIYKVFRKKDVKVNGKRINNIKYIINEMILFKFIYLKILILKKIQIF